MSQGFRLAYPAKGITQYSFDQIKRAQSYLTISLNPITQILAEFWLEDRHALNAANSLFLAWIRQDQPRDAILLQIEAQ